MPSLTPRLDPFIPLFIQEPGDRQLRLGARSDILLLYLINEPFFNPLADAVEFAGLSVSIGDFL